MRKKGMSICASLLIVSLLSPPGLAVRMLIPCGMPTGVRMTAKGVVVCGMNDISSAAGKVCPAEEAGLRTGDILYSVNGTEISSGEEFAQEVAESDGEPVTLEGERDDVTVRVTVQPVMSTADSMYHLGLLVRDSMAGIGTITYVDPQSGEYGALGHAVCEVDSGTKLPLEDGSLMPASVVDITEGKRGEPGELIGSFELDKTMGTITKNTACGIFGTLGRTINGKALPVASADEVKTGDAQILACVGGSDPKKFTVRIERIMGKDAQGKSMAIHVTDDRLIDKTGGIVQGMSGSPIIQDGKLVGAVTHVTVNDPTRGYGIFIENMLEQ